MTTIDSARRDLLRLGGFGLAASAVSAIPALAAPKKIVGPGVSPVFFDVRTFGATGDSKTVDSQAINKAIEAAAAAGGGTVVFPAGTYMCFSIRLKSKVDLFLSQGCTIEAAESPKPGETTGYMGGTYDAAEPKTTYDAFQDYGHNHWHNSLIWGENVSDVSITGPGLIFGKGLSFGSGPARPPGAPPRGFGPERVGGPGVPGAQAAGAGAPTTPGAPGGQGTPRPGGFQPRTRGNYTMYQAEQAGVGNKAIAMKNCRNVTFRDFSILKGGHFGLLLTGVDNLTIDNLTIDTDRDGMDIDCCRNVRVSNCVVNSPWDDGICPKSSFALGYNRACENMNITNCYVTGAYRLGTILDGTFKKFDGTGDDHGKIGGTGRIKCGTESNGGFKNITISNCVFEGCQGLCLETVDGALLEDFTVTNLTMRDIISCPIFFRLGARLRGPKGTGDQSTVVGTLRRVLVSNVNCYNTASRFGSNITGIPNYYVQDVKFSDIYVEPQGGGGADTVSINVPEKEDGYPEPGMLGPLPTYGFYFRHVKRLEMDHVEVRPIKPDARPAIYTEDVQRADFSFITAPSEPAAFSFNKTTDVRVMMSRAGKDQTIA
ncbi:MAG TPA: glycosyl hydrolase family 28-related protein [Acidobacteriaceae bacterium]|jgi:polygalacturonase|nr:glycosyl hydrolase family 28-related protein [Acidobacteriaceae bacterium]